MGSNIIHVLASLSDLYYRKHDKLVQDVILFYLSKLSTKVLGVTEPRAPMEYYSIYESNHFHICIIVLRKGSVIPLHDHPGMVVFSTLVRGTINIETYQWIDSSSNQAAVIDHKTINAESSDSVLRIFHGFGPSLHAFECLSDYAVIVDVMGPPYDDDGCCKYYRAKDGYLDETIGKRIVTLEEFHHQGEDFVECAYSGDKVSPTLFNETALGVLSLLHNSDN